ncbi:hypothetical protein NQ318_000179, partial [Aromia moschata]
MNETTASTINHNLVGHLNLMSSVCVRLSKQTYMEPHKRWHESLAAFPPLTIMCSVLSANIRASPSVTMSGPFKRRPSLKTLPPISLPPGASRKGSIRRQSSAGLLSKPAVSQQEVPWDILDRCLLPVIFCHAAAVILSNALNVLHISEVTTFTLFIWFTIVTIGAVLFYHNLK